MDIDDTIKELKVQRTNVAAREREKMYCYRCGQMVLVYRPTTDDLRRDPTLDDYIGDNYCSRCIEDIVGGIHDPR